jgi:alkanesulfonate monooxygenase SsuD/methylene tetrahydromethanopterin reductase-like flavin-dependent oxidoreductase (luciferase family)
MAKARKGTKAAAKSKAPSRRARKPAAKNADFCVAANDALKRGEPDAISDRTLQQVLTAAVKVYAAKVERRGHDVEPFPRGTVTATETVVTACGLIRAADLNMFDVAIWFHRPPGIE